MKNKSTDMCNEIIAVKAKSMASNSNMADIENQVKLKHPFTLVMAGPTSSGKTVLTREIMQHHEITCTFNKKQIKVLYCYGQMQAIYKQPIANVLTKYHEGLCNEEEMREFKPDLIIIDDLMMEVGDDPNMANLFTKVSHHLNISVIFIVQNMFFQAKHMRTISLNAHYYILLKNPRDKLQVLNLGRQILPGQSKYFAEVYSECTREPYSNLIIDMTSTTPDALRLRSMKVVKGEIEFTIYKPR